MNILSFIGTIFGIFLSGFAILKIYATNKVITALTGNDLKHLIKDINELKTDFKNNKLRVWDKFDAIEKDVEGIGKGLEFLKGKLNNT